MRSCTSVLTRASNIWEIFPGGYNGRTIFYRYLPVDHNLGQIWKSLKVLGLINRVASRNAGLAPGFSYYGNEDFGEEICFDAGQLHNHPFLEVQFKPRHDIF